MEKNIEFLSNNDGKLMDRLKSLHNKKNTLNVPNNQRAGGDAPNIRANTLSSCFDLLIIIVSIKRNEINF